MNDLQTDTLPGVIISRNVLPDTSKAEASLKKLMEYCEKESFRGYDPYDGLNSTLFRAIPFLSGSRFARLFWIQLFKRLPFNLRPLAGVKKEYNPKGLGLFLSGYCNLFKLSPGDHYMEKIDFLTRKIPELQSKGWSGTCWGYNFDWQARAFFQPKNTPTVVATTFIASALLDAYEITGVTELKSIARSACDFIMKDLNRTYDPDGDFAFSYSPLDKSVVFNASLLGSRLLARVYSITHEAELAECARKSVAYCCKYQRQDGAWTYGRQPFHQWIDNFHTGYNLECLADYMNYTGDHSYRMNLRKGLEYYLNSFFTTDGMPMYFNNAVYPVDIHSSSQLLITLIKTDLLYDHLDLAVKVTDWTIGNMQSKRGYFYFQKKRFLSSKVPYMRWGQAWMFYALSSYLYHISRLNPLPER